MSRYQPWKMRVSPAPQPPWSLRPLPQTASPTGQAPCGQRHRVLAPHAARVRVYVGSGADSLVGGAGDDILIAGYTLHDFNESALGAILDEWSADRSYEQRVANIRGDPGATVTLSWHFSTSTVLDDGDGDGIDLLVGSAGTDWFWADRSSGEDKVAGVTGDEQVQDT